MAVVVVVVATVAEVAGFALRPVPFFHGICRKIHKKIFSVLRGMKKIHITKIYNGSLKYGGGMMSELNIPIHYISIQGHKHEEKRSLKDTRIVLDAAIFVSGRSL